MDKLTDTDRMMLGPVDSRRWMAAEAERCYWLRKLGLLEKSPEHTCGECSKYHHNAFCDEPGKGDIGYDSPACSDFSTSITPPEEE